MDVNSELLTLIGILFAAVITPGPNNVLVFHTAATGGIKSAVPLIAGVISGSLLLLFCTMLGIGLMLKSYSYLQLPFSILGAVYLIVMGSRMFTQINSAGFQYNNPPILPKSYLAVAAFQFVNPKSWILMSVVSTQALLIMHWISLMGILILIMGICLLLWTYAGVYLNTKIQNPLRLLLFNRTMGAMLIFFAITLLWQNI